MIWPPLSAGVILALAAGALMLPDALATGGAPDGGETDAGAPDAEAAQGLSFLYPLDHRPRITSKFGAYRIGHHHAGLDLYAGDTEDTRVLAAADGVVFRMRRNHVGYGRALYVRHEGGWITIYAHLSAFDPVFAEFERAAEARAQDFRFNERLSPPIRVRAGQPLGWIGTSGTDLVHLHFETRRGPTPVDPLKNGLDIPDTQPPVFRTLMAFPKDAASHVRHAHDEAFLPFDTQRPGEPQRLGAPVEIGGDVALLVEVHDPVDGSERALIPSELSLHIDGVLHHQVAYDEMSYADPSQTELDYHPRLRNRDKRVFHKLYREGPRVRVHRPAPKNGTRHLTAGDHEARLVARDAAGNVGEAVFTLRVVKPEPPCAHAEGRVAAGKGVPPEVAGPRTWHHNTVVVPLPEICGTAQPPTVSVLRDGDRRRRGWRLTRLDGQAALALDAPLSASADHWLGWAADDGPRWVRLNTAPMRSGKTTQLGPVRVEVGKKSLFFPYPTDLVTEPAPEQKGLVVGGPEMYRLGNGWRPTLRASSISVPLPPNVPHDGLGLYFIEGTRAWLIGSRKAEGRIYGATVHLGDVAVMRDLEPPVIGTPTWAAHPAGARLVVPISDAGSGLSRIEIQVDGQTVHHEWQRAWERAVWLPLVSMKPGARRVTVTARDRAGRQSTATHTVKTP